MSKYQEFKEQFHTLREADAAYWERLKEAMKKLRLGFADFLGVDANSPLGEDGSFPALYFGGKSNSFSGKSDDDTVREGNEFVFTLNLVIDPVECVFPPNALKFRCRIKYVAGEYMFLLSGLDESYTIVSEDDFSPIYERLHLASTRAMAGYRHL